MSQPLASETPPTQALARALGRLPTGLYIVTTSAPADALGKSAPLGFVGSFVMQVGLAPPVLCVAVGKDRGPLTALRASSRFAINILDGASQGVMKRFFRKYPVGEGPFDGLTLEHQGGVPVLPEALAWIACRVIGEHELADHVVVFGEAIAGRQAREGDPAVHLRKDGLGY